MHVHNMKLPCTLPKNSQARRCQGWSMIVMTVMMVIDDGDHDDSVIQAPN